MQVQEIAPGLIYTAESFFSPSECEHWIEVGESHGFGHAPITTLRGPLMAPEIRNNTRVMVDDVKAAEALWSKARALVPAVYRGREAIGLNERFRLYRYDPHQYFAPHSDGSYRRENGERSFFTFMVYLNEDFSGGETRFDDLRIVPKAGLALVFMHHLEHEGAPVLEGRKYVLRTDVMYCLIEERFR